MSASDTPQWRWSEDWNLQLPNHSEDFEGEKYADLSLRDAEGNPIIQIGVDHYCFVFSGTIKPEHRALIARAPDLERSCAELRKALEEIISLAGPAGVYPVGFAANCIEAIKTIARTALRGTTSHAGAGGEKP